MHLQVALYDSYAHPLFRVSQLNNGVCVSSSHRSPVVRQYIGWRQQRKEVVLPPPLSRPLWRLPRLNVLQVGVLLLPPAVAIARSMWPEIGSSGSGVILLLRLPYNRRTNSNRLKEVNFIFLSSVEFLFLGSFFSFFPLLFSLFPQVAHYGPSVVPSAATFVAASPGLSSFVSPSVNLHKNETEEDFLRRHNCSSNKFSFPDEIWSSSDVDNSAAFLVFCAFLMPLPRSTSS